MDQIVNIRAARPLWLIVRCVKASIQRHPMEVKSIHHFASDAGIDSWLLQKAFKIKYGLSIQVYQIVKRIEAAAEILNEGRLSGQQIAERCGYHTLNIFRRSFKKVFKCTPVEWQFDTISRTRENGIEETTGIYIQLRQGQKGKMAKYTKRNIYYRNVLRVL